MNEARRIAEQIAAEHIGSASYYAEQRRLLADAVEAALMDGKPRIKEAALDEILTCDKCDLCEDHHE